MSIRAQIWTLWQTGKLSPFQPETRQPARRRAFLTRDFDDKLNDADSVMNFYGWSGYTKAALTRWTSGGKIWTNEKREPMFLKPLEPPPRDIWEIKITEPDPQLRLFCRFAEPDTLIVTHAINRNELGDDKGGRRWRGAMSDCENTWKQLFPNTPPWSGSKSGDFITENYDDFDVP